MHARTHSDTQPTSEHIAPKRMHISPRINRDVRQIIQYQRRGGPEIKLLKTDSIDRRVCDDRVDVRVDCTRIVTASLQAHPRHYVRRAGRGTHTGAGPAPQQRSRNRRTHIESTLRRHRRTLTLKIGRHSSRDFPGEQRECW